MNDDKENRTRAADSASRQQTDSNCPSRRHKAKRNRVSKHEHGDLCTRCGKTPRTTTPPQQTTPQQTKPLSISLLKREKKKSTKKCGSRSCKHKEELARFTDVSATTVDTTSESENSYSTVYTQGTQRSVRSMVREGKAKQEIDRLQSMNSQLTAQLEALAKGTTIRDLCADVLGDITAKEELHRSYLDNTLTLNGEPRNISNRGDLTPTNIPDIQDEEREMKDYTTSPYLGGPREDVLGIRATPLIVAPRHDTPIKRTPNSDTRAVTIGAASEKLHVDDNLDSGYSSVRDKLKQHRNSSSINRELLAELEEENEGLRVELKTSITNTEELVALEKEIRRMRAESSSYQHEIMRLKDIETKLHQVEHFYHNEKKNFRCTIEDTLLTLQDFRQDKDILENELLQLHEKMKDEEVKKAGIEEHLKEQNTLLANNVEKLKLELGTGQSETAMLQTRISTVEENCSFLEGQVQALERDNQEKLHVISAAEQHAKDLEKDLGSLRKETTHLQSEQLRIQPLESDLEQLKENTALLKEENSSLQEKLVRCEEEKMHQEEKSSQLHGRLGELVKSHTKSEECVQQKERELTGLKEQLAANQREASAVVSTATRKEGELQRDNEQLGKDLGVAVKQLEEARNEIDFVEKAFFKGWSDDVEDTEKLVKFQDENKEHMFPKSYKLIQSIKLDRQKLKAKLVRSVQDSKSVQSKLSDTQEVLDRESAALAKRVREALDRLEGSEMKGHVLERTAKNLSLQVEELSVVNRSLELENYHLKKLSQSLVDGTSSNT